MTFFPINPDAVQQESTRKDMDAVKKKKQMKTAV